MTRYAKSISRFDPLAALTIEECERHYVQVHTHWARRMLRDRDHVISYHVDRALAQYDIGGAFRQRPAAWRYVILRLSPGARLGLSADEQEMVAQDHRNVLRDLRSRRVEESVLVDRLAGQTALEKYLFEYERSASTDTAEAQARLAALGDTLAAWAGAAFGCRLVLIDRVVGEQDADPIDEPGQRPVGRSVTDPVATGFLELYFDNTDWAEEFFVRPDVRRLLCDPWFAIARGYHVEERCGLDRREVVSPHSGRG